MKFPKLEQSTWIILAEWNWNYLSLLVTTQFEMFATFQRNLLSVFALGTLHSQHNFLRCFSLETKIVEDWWDTETRKLIDVDAVSDKFVVFTFFRKIGFVWPPKPCCLRSYRRRPCDCARSFDFLYCVTLWVLCDLHFLQKVRRCFGTFTWNDERMVLLEPTNATISS